MNMNETTLSYLSTYSVASEILSLFEERRFPSHVIYNKYLQDGLG